jgi:serine/threonine-protein kinase
MTAEREDRGLEEAPLKPGDLFQSKWEILRLLGRGGYAWVYHARHRFIDRHVAIKIIFKPGGVSQDVFRRGLAEAQIQHKLDHTNIVKVDDAGTSDDGGFLYIIMELLRGWSWRSMLAEFKRLRVEEALRLAASVADAMQVAHNGGIIHRDLKPENVFVVGDNQPKVLDFGIAKINQAAWVTEKDMVLGTMIYMSPEQVQAMPLTPKSDIYALGIMMYEALAGQHPVYMLLKTPQANLYELSRIVVTQTPPSLHEIDPRIPPYVADLVYPALAKPPNERFASMKAFAHAIRACLRRYETEALERGISLRTRDLSRRPVTTSGVNEVDAQESHTDRAVAASLQGGEDTEPNSSPMFLGTISSGMMRDQARVAGALAPTVAVRALGNVPAAQVEPAIRTAPLGSPPERIAEVRNVVPVSSEPEPIRAASRASAPARREGRGSVAGALKPALESRAHGAPPSRQTPAKKPPRCGTGTSAPVVIPGEARITLPRVLTLGAVVGFVAFGAIAVIYASGSKTSRDENSAEPSAVRVTPGPARSAASARQGETEAAVAVPSAAQESPPTSASVSRPTERASTPSATPVPAKARAKSKPADKMEERLRRFEAALDEQKAPSQPSADPSAPPVVGPMF